MTGKYRILATVLLLLGLGSLYAETLDHHSLIDQTGSRLLWDPLQKKGILLKEGKSIVFMADESILLLNGTDVVHTGAILYERGVLKFSSDTVDLIVKFFQDKGAAPKKPAFRVAAIILDPGHGGRDSGATSNFAVDGIATPLQEKNLVLDITLALKEKLEEEFPDKNIILTRENDIYPTLEDRVELANSVTADRGEGIVYISVHGNASLNKDAEGFEVWYLPEDYRRQVLPGEGNESIDSVLNTLMEEEFTLESRTLANSILDHLDSKVGHKATNRGLKEESWFVVRNAMMASVLIETGFVTNRTEAQRLRNPQYLKSLSNGIYNGIVDFVDFFENRYNQ